MLLLTQKNVLPYLILQLILQLEHSSKVPDSILTSSVVCAEFVCSLFNHVDVLWMLWVLSTSRTVVN